MIEVIAVRWLTSNLQPFHLPDPTGVSIIQYAEAWYFILHMA